jgi:RNA polymerase sigma factor (sigma-70 family)
MPVLEVDAGDALPGSGPQSGTSTSGDLLRAAWTGEEDAWAQLLSRHTALLWSIGRSFRLSPTAVEDMAQTVWLRLLERGSAIRDPDAVTAWLAITARRECLAICRRVRERSGDALPEPVEDWQPPDASMRAERDRVLWAAVQRIPQRDAMLLRLLAVGLRYDEIAAAMDIPRGSVGPTRARAMAKVRIELRRAGVNSLADAL